MLRRKFLLFLISSDDETSLNDKIIKKDTKFTSKV